MRSHGDDAARLCVYCHKPCAYAAFHKRCKDAADKRAVPGDVTPPAFRGTAKRLTKGKRRKGG